MTVKSKVKHLALLILLCSVALATAAPREEQRSEKKTARLVGLPQKVGEWTLTLDDDTASAKEAGFLNEVAFRTYQRKDGKTVVLVVAYGADQRKKYNLHSPEVCYKASGYQVMSESKAAMGDPELKLKQLVVSSGPADTQPVQYWIMLDGKQVTGELEKRIRHLYYSMVGAQSDGVLVRVSSFTADGDPEKDYELQREFISSLYRSVDPNLKKLLFGA